MPFYLLIDTSILRRLVARDSISDYLLQLDFSVKRKDIVLLYPVALQEEWQKHRVLVQKEIADELKEWRANLKRQQTVNHMMADFTEQQFADLNKKLHSQIDLLDELLASYAVHLSRTDEIDLSILKRHKEKKAPFHIPGKDNFNDAELLFYPVSYLQKNDANELHFVSGNTKDFAVMDEGAFILHPDIHLLFANTRIHFKDNIDKTFQQLYEEGLTKRDKERAQTQNQRKIRNVVQVDQSLPILDQVYQYLDKRFGDLIVLPKEIFAEHYPFILNSAFVFAHRPFTLITDNPEVHRLLTQVKIENETILEDKIGFIATADDKKKIIDIFKYLNQNFIYNIAFEHGNPVTIHFQQTAPGCDCTECLHGHLRFDELMVKLSTEKENQTEQTIQQRMNLAYIFYKTGNFVRAAEMFEQIKNTRTGKKDVLQFILYFNLYNLGGLIKNYYFRDSVLKKRGESLRSIDLDEAFEQCVTPVNKSELQWIYQRLFYKEGLAKLQEETAVIRDNFYGQNGGNNEHMLQVLETYHATASFLDKNAIVYDVFLEFHELTSVYTDAVFASHGCSERLDGKLQYFDNDRLKKLALNGKADEIQKFIKRYKHKKIIYQPSAGDTKSFPEAFIHLLDEYHAILKMHGKDIQSKNEWFSDFFTDVLFNSLVLVSVLDLTDGMINTIAQKLLIVQRLEPRLHPYLLLTHLKWFFSKNEDRLAAAIVKEYLQLSVDTSEYHDDLWFQQLSDILEKRNVSFELAPANFDQAIKNFMEECKKCKRTHGWAILTELYKLTKNPKQKHSIAERIKNSLRLSFDSAHYYLVATTGIIEASPEQTALYTQEIENRVLEGKRPRFMPQTDYYTDPLLDQYLNFCFKHGFAIPQSMVKQLVTLDPYYQWLLDLDGFDYALFELKWMFHYFTIFYKRRFRNSQILKQHLLQLITKDPTNELAVRFVFIYCKND